MRKNKRISLIIALNLSMSLFVVYLNPRFDILTLIGFLLINIILFIVISKIEKEKEKALDDKILMYTTTTRNGYRQYKSDPKDCKDCWVKRRMSRSIAS